MGGRCPWVCRPRTQVQSYVGRASERKVGYRSGPENLKAGGWEGGSSKGQRVTSWCSGSQSAGRLTNSYRTSPLTCAGPGVKTSSPCPRVKLARDRPTPALLEIWTGKRRSLTVEKKHGQMKDQYDQTEKLPAEQ